jgi:hypothetical protein
MYDEHTHNVPLHWIIIKKRNKLATFFFKKKGILVDLYNTLKVYIHTWDGKVVNALTKYGMVIVNFYWNNPIISGTLYDGI